MPYSTARAVTKLRYYVIRDHDFRLHSEMLRVQYAVTQTLAALIPLTIPMHIQSCTSWSKCYRQVHMRTHLHCHGISA